MANIRQRVFTRADFGLAENETGHEDAVLDPNDPIYEMMALAGVQRPQFSEYKGHAGSNISATANKNAELMKQHNIKPGTPEWFQLWFSKPYLTGEPPVNQ